MILNFFGPEYEEPEAEAKPDWVQGVAAELPGMADLESELATKNTEIVSLRAALEAVEIKKRELEHWTELLWLDGAALQRRVSAALALLGIPNGSNDSTGHVHDLEGNCEGHLLFFEVTGSTGSIGVDKGRQLLQWIATSNDPTNTKGILIGNAFRKNSPDARPPSPNHRVFVKDLEDMAKRFHFGLLDVRDLFDIVVRKLNGEDIKAEFVCEKLQADGQIEFYPR